MKARLVVGEGAWPTVTVLRHALTPARAGARIVLDLHGRGASMLRDEARAFVRERLDGWYDLADRRAPASPWRYRPTDAGDRALRHVVSGWAVTLGVDALALEVDALVGAARALTAAARGPSDSLPAITLLDIVRALRSPRHPSLLATLAPVTAVDPIRLRPLLDALATALRYPAVFSAVCSPELSRSGRTDDVTWFETPRAHLEPVEWQLLTRLAVAAAIERCASVAPVEVVVIDPARGAGTCIEPTWFREAAIVTAAWTPAGESADVVLRPWVGAAAHAWIAPNALRSNVWERCLPPGAFEALRSLRAGEMIATTLTRGAEWLRRPVVRDDAPNEALRPTRRRADAAPSHVADAAAEALRERTPSQGLLGRIASLPALRRAWHRLRTGNLDLFGTDMVTARAFATNLGASLVTLRAEILDGTYRPLPLRRVTIPKPDGGVRPLGIVTVRDRIAQTACLDVIDPIMDATFSEHSYAYRHRRGAPLAVLAAMDALHNGARWLVRCDVSQCFDSLDHEVLFRQVREVVRDDDLVHLLGLWARADILVGEDLVASEIGVPQGTVLAPLLCNLYLTPLDRALEDAAVSFIRYADDLLLCAADEAAAREALALVERTLSGPLRLRLNPRKTLVARADDGIDHLGFRLSTSGLDIQPEKIDRLLGEVRRRLGEVTRAHGDGEAAVREAFASVLAVLRGFAAYYQSVGAAPKVEASLARAGRAVEALSIDALPPALHDHPLWRRRDALWRGELPEREREAPPPAGLYLDRRAKTVVDPFGRDPAPPAPPAAPEPTEPLARGILMDEGNLHVLRHGVYLTLRGEHLVLRARGDAFERVPLGTLRSITVSGLGTGVSTALARWLSRAGVPMLLGAPTDTEYTLITSPALGTPRVRAAQAIHRDQPHVARCGLAMLHGKIAGQASVLRYYAKYRRRRADSLHSALDDAAARIRDAADRVAALSTEGWDAQRKVAMGHEGIAAAIYWDSVAKLVPPELGFSARCTRGATDPMNQCLNYAYGCLYAEVWRAVQQAGLDPCVGVVHGSERGDASLVFDLVEELRPNFGDRLILSLLGRGFRPCVGARGVLSTASRRTIARAFRRVATRGARRRGATQSLSKIALAQARAFRAVVLGEATSYRAFHMRW